MPARTFPAEPAFTTASEKAVWQRVVRQLDPESAVLANLRIADAHKDHEADLVVLMPDSGVVVVEVKGSHVWVDGGTWFIDRGQGYPDFRRNVISTRTNAPEDSTPTPIVGEARQ